MKTWINTWKKVKVVEENSKLKMSQPCFISITDKKQLENRIERKDNF